jgi:hypothetical protein
LEAAKPAVRVEDRALSLQTVIHRMATKSLGRIFAYREEHELAAARRGDLIT